MCDKCDDAIAAGFYFCTKCGEGLPRLYSLNSDMAKTHAGAVAGAPPDATKAMGMTQAVLTRQNTVTAEREPSSIAEHSAEHITKDSVEAFFEAPAVRSSEETESTISKSRLFACIGAAMLILVLLCVVGCLAFAPLLNYNNAIDCMVNEDYRLAISLFEKNSQYKRSAEYIQECNYRIASKLFEELRYAEARESYIAAGDYSDAAYMAAECDYIRASTLLNNGNIGAAYALFVALGEHSDSAAMAQQCRYLSASAALNAGDYDSAIQLFGSLGAFSDSMDRLLESRYRKAHFLLKSDAAAAKAIFTELGDYANASEMVKECDYRTANALFENGDYSAAAAAFGKLGNYADSAVRVKACRYYIALGLFDSGNLEAAIAILKAIADYDEAKALLADCYFIIGSESYENFDYANAKRLLSKSGNEDAENLLSIICNEELAASDFAAWYAIFDAEGIALQLAEVRSYTDNIGNDCLFLRIKAGDYYFYSLIINGEYSGNCWEDEMGSYTMNDTEYYVAVLVDSYFNSFSNDYDVERILSLTGN